MDVNRTQRAPPTGDFLCSSRGWKNKLRMHCHFLFIPTPFPCLPTTVAEQTASLRKQKPVGKKLLSPPPPPAPPTCRPASRTRHQPSPPSCFYEETICPDPTNPGHLHQLPPDCLRSHPISPPSPLDYSHQHTSMLIHFSPCCFIEMKLT